MIWFNADEFEISKWLIGSTLESKSKPPQALDYEIIFLFSNDYLNRDINNHPSNYEGPRSLPSSAFINLTNNFHKFRLLNNFWDLFYLSVANTNNVSNLR